jgi:hypothetical protein
VLPDDLPSFCLSSSNKDEELAQTFLSYINANPSKANDMAGTTVLEALSLAKTSACLFRPHRRGIAGHIALPRVK